MSGSDLQHSSSKFNIDVLIGHDGNVRLIFCRKRADGMLADQMAIARVLGVDRNAGISRNGFGSGRRNFQAHLRLFHHLNREVVELAFLRGRDDFFIRKRGQ